MNAKLPHPPEKIWLQWHGDGDPSNGDPVPTTEVTWNAHKVWQGDVCYIRADVADKAKGGKNESWISTADKLPEVGQSASLRSGDLLACPFCGRAADLEVAVRDDEHRFPRPHWHAKVECSWCLVGFGWETVSDQEAKSPDWMRVSRVVAKWNTRAKPEEANTPVSGDAQRRSLERAG